MTGRALLLTLAVCAVAAGQFQIVDMGNGAICDGGHTIDLGKVAVGGLMEEEFSITNTGTVGARLDTLGIRGTGWAFANRPDPLLTLLPHQSAGFAVSLVPSASGGYSATLSAGTQSCILIANAVEAPTLPKFRITVEPGTLSSGRQGKLSLKFDAAAETTAYGRLKLDFAGKGDPAIRFISPASRSVPFTISKGEDFARFGGQAWIDFQTGTTAGVLTFTATLGAETEQAVFALPASTVLFDSVRFNRTSTGLSLAITGYDNTRSAYGATFTFFDRNSQVLGGGSIRADVTAAFASYFEHAELGGQFVLRADFPVSGDVSQIDSVKIEFTNPAGVSWTNAKIAE